MTLVATSKDRLYTGITAIVIIGAIVLGYFLFSGGSSHTVWARFQNAQFIVPGNTVHVNGVTEGKVTAMKVDSASNTALVKMTLDKDAWPLHTDATATVRPISILGEQYVDLNTGTASKPAMADGAIIPSSQTTSATNLQSVLNAVTDPTATELGVLVSSLGQGMAGEGVNAQDAIKALDPALTNTSALLKLVNSQNALLNNMIDNATPVLDALNTHQGTTLDGLLTTTNSLLTATAQSSTNMGRDLQELPGTLTAATSTFNQLGNLADQATPALASITPLTNNLNAVSHEILNFSQAANPAVNSLTPLLSQAQTLINKATPVVNTLKASGPQGLADLQNGETILHGNVADLSGFFSFISEWASTTGDYDGTSHYFRFHFQAECGSGVEGPGCPAAAANAATAKPAAASTATAKPATATPAKPAANAGGIINNILSQPTQVVNGLVGGLLGTNSTSGTNAAPSGSATGLSSSQEQNLVGYLLGGL